jgi:hypothetical protein
VFRHRKRPEGSKDHGSGDRPEVIEVEVERIDPGPSSGQRLRRRAVQTLAPVLLAMLIDAGDLATFPGTTVIALPLGMLAGYLFSGFLRVATPWRILISGITGLYWALPFTGFFPLATSITTVTEFFSGKLSEDEPRS